MEAQNKPMRTEQEQQKADEAIKSLRKKIIASISDEKGPYLKISLGELLWQDAASCFPKPGFQWDGAWFTLDLETEEIKVKVTTYPDQFGACRESAFTLSVSGFNEIAKQYKLFREFQVIGTEEDWARVFDDGLRAEIAAAGAELRKREEERQNKENKKYAVTIHTNIVPDMNIREVKLVLSQRYATGEVKVTNENGKYRIRYDRISTMSSDRESYSRVLDPAESGWLEMKVENAISDPDDSAWQSLPGGDSMDIVIKRGNGEDVVFERTKPLRKYSGLMSDLQKLAQYGSKLGIEASEGSGCSAEEKEIKQPAEVEKADAEKDARKAEKERAEKAAAMAEKYQELLKREGKLPEGFSLPYDRVFHDGMVVNKTPFSARLQEIGDGAGTLNNRSGISDWLYFDGSVEINAAAAAIADWYPHNLALNPFCLGQVFTRYNCIIGEIVMIVLEDGEQFQKLTEESLRMCKEAGISFCTVLSDRRLYDLMEQSEKELTYETYLNYHDETCADWRFRNCENA